MRAWTWTGIMIAAALLLGCGGGEGVAPGVPAPAGGSAAGPGSVPRSVPGDSAATIGVAGAEAKKASPADEDPELVYTRKFYAYRVAKGRDPFRPLVTEGSDLNGLSLASLRLTGILWDDGEGMVVLEDTRGRGYPMRVGDRLAGARLVAIRKDAAVYRVVEFGEVHSVVKKLFVPEERPI